ncbi:MAG: hypothetical protein ABEJ69_00865 [Candidatus Nanohaloarchaea archaeon]
MLRKGVGIGSVATLILGVLTASLFVGVSTAGDLGGAIKTGFEMVNKKTDYQLDVTNYTVNGKEVQPDEVLSQAALFVYQRASNDGCKKGGGKDPNVYEQYTAKKDGRGGHDSYISKNGFPALTKTYLTDRPPCVGTASGLSNDITANLIGSDTGNDMEGIYSRVAFEIPESANNGKPIILEDGGDTWLEKHILAASTKGWDQSVKDSCFGSQKGTGNEFMIFFAGTHNRRSSYPIQEASADVSNRDINPYCDEKTPGRAGVYDDDSVESSSKTSKLDNAEVMLCPGDEGYIQMNKGSATNDGEAGEGYGHDEGKYPHIVITEPNPRCALTPQVRKEDAVGGILITAQDANDLIGDHYPVFANPDFLRLSNTNIDPKKAKFDLFKFEGSQETIEWDEWDDSGDFHVTRQNKNRCAIGLFEDDMAQSEDGYIEMKPGTIIPKSGDFPTSGVTLKDLQDDDNGVISQPDVITIWNRLTGQSGSSDEGLTGEKLNYDIRSGILERFQGHLKYKMYGDLLCANIDGDAYMEWAMCHQSLADDYAWIKNGVDAGGTHYECGYSGANPSNEWSPS